MSNEKFKFEIPLQEEIWEKKYRAADDGDILGTWRRVARGASSVEGDALSNFWFEEFFNILYDFKFIPGGRVTEGIGTKNQYLNNCFVLDVKDDLEDIYDTIKRVAIISKKNGGVGINFSKIRPIGAPLSGGGSGSGVVSFMEVFDTSCKVIKTGSKNRRAALMGILMVDHPEIFEFLLGKREKGKLENFNISVGITDAFMVAVRDNLDWALQFEGTVYRTVKARDLWNALCESGWLYNDPGIFFYDTTNKTNNGWYLYDIRATNPCGELGLPEWAACCLGNVNVTKFVIDPFASVDPYDNFDWIGYIKTVSTAVRFLDNILDVTEYPYEENKDVAMRDRRIGLNGVAGLGSALAMLGLSYDSAEARKFAEHLQKVCTENAYLTSIDLAKRKGAFPSFDAEHYCSGDFVKSLPQYIQDLIAEFGTRNIAILTIPPVGTGSLLAANISSGHEPMFALEYIRLILNPDGTKTPEPVEDYAWRLWKQLGSDLVAMKVKPDYFKTAMEMTPYAHIEMQAVLQKWIDGSISKTVNIPNEYSLEQYKDVLEFAWKKGLKGITTFRDGTREGVLSTGPSKEEPQAKEKIDIASIKRPRVLDGKTYQIQEEAGHRTYCTVNYLEESGRKLPWEIFLFSSSRNHDLYAAIGRLASRLMRKTGDVQSVVNELKEIGGDNGYFTQEFGYVQSKPQHFGYILEEFLNGLNGETDPKEFDTGETCVACGGRVVKRGGCKQCENGCIESYKCG